MRQDFTLQDFLWRNGTHPYFPRGEFPWQNCVRLNFLEPFGVRIEEPPSSQCSLYNKWWSLHRPWRSIGRRSMYSTPYVCIVYSVYVVREQPACHPCSGLRRSRAASAIREWSPPSVDKSPHPRIASAICGWSSPSVEEAAS